MTIQGTSPVFGGLARQVVPRRRIFLAEDDDTLRALVASTLRAAGYHVMEARDGLELLAGLEHALVSEHERPEHLVVVSDIEMPGLSGLDVLTIVRCASLDTAIPMNKELEEQFLAKARLAQMMEKLLNY